MFTSTSFFNSFLFIAAIFLYCCPSTAKYALLTDVGVDVGVGNRLFFYPSAFYFAQLTGRILVIDADSSLGRFCRLVSCSFEVTHELIGNHTYGNSDFKRFANQSLTVPEDDVILLADETPWNKVCWWSKNSSLQTQISSISNCNNRDLICTDRFALEQLIVGPIKSFHLTQGGFNMRNDTLSNLFSSKYKDTKLFDIGIHLRAKFPGYENGNVLRLKYELTYWLESENAWNIFESFVTKISEYIKFHPWKTVVRVYIAGDCQEIKDVLVKRIKSSIGNDKIDISMISSRSLQHSHVSKSIESSDILSFDWYCLSLSRQILSWRKTKGITYSTFAISARKIKGEAFDNSTCYDDGSNKVGSCYLKDSYALQLVGGRNKHKFLPTPSSYFDS